MEIFTNANTATIWKIHQNYIPFAFFDPKMILQNGQTSMILKNLGTFGPNIC